jgi:dTDP-4-amino-4,6-dideoxygalactose transaminase
MSIASNPQIISLPSDQDSSGRTLGQEEIEAVSKAILSGTLTATKGQFAKELERQFGPLVDCLHTHACSSGSAAMHTGVAAMNLEPGQEIITTSITDMGALTAIIYQGIIPRFADVDPLTYNVTAESIAKCISPRTGAIAVTHLFGNPCEMNAICELAAKHNLPIIEDCAQAFLATHHGKQVGSFGAVGCFSLQQGKHITTGEGGLVVSNDADIARRMYLFINKAWGYGDANPDHYFLAPNYRLNELTAAVAVAQLEKLNASVANRRSAAALMHEMIADLPGIQLPTVHAGNEHSYWKYCVNVDPNQIPGGTVALAKKLKERGVFSAPRYIQKPAFQCQVIRDQQTFGNSRWPFTLADQEALDYSPERFPGTFEALAKILVLPWNEAYTNDHVAYVANAMRESIAELCA